MKDFLKDFPILNIKPHGKRLAYLDNAATTQKPKAMIDSLTEFYNSQNANVHRGVHFLSEIATAKFEQSREKIKKFINAPHSKNCIFTKGTTDGINLVAHGFRNIVQTGDEIIISALEHHSNLVPWQVLCKEKNANLKIIPLNQDGSLKIEELEHLITAKTKLIAISHTSNALGTIVPLKQVIDIAKKDNIPVLIDGAQALAHSKIDVSELDCDFFATSAHKMYGPTGIGFLYMKDEWLEKLPPYQTGGEMVLEVTHNETVYNIAPYKFEAGTPDIANVISFGATIDYLETLNFEEISLKEKHLLKYATDKLKKIPQVKIIAENLLNKSSIISFTIEGIHAHDVGTILDTEGVAVRTGHHCAMPIMQFYNIDASVRASFAMYNTEEDVDQLINAINLTLKTFKKI